MGDIILTREAPFGEVGMLKSCDNLFLGQRLILFRINEEKANSKFVLYSFQHADMQTQLKALASGSTVEHIRVPDAESITIELPERKIQDRIATVLSSYEDLFDNHSRRIAILEELAQRLYREWFVHFRFPKYENVKMVESELGMIPEGWSIKPFSDLVVINPKYSKPQVNSFSYVEMAGLNNKNMLVNLAGKRDKFAGSKFSNGDTLVARITPCLENGKTGFVQCLKENEVGVGSTEFIVLRSDKLSPEMVYLIARQSDFRGILIKSMFGASGRQRANVDVLKEYRIPFPPAEIISTFQKRVQPLFKNIEILNKKSINLQRTRDLLLPRLISGDIDVSSIDKPVSEVSL